MIRLFPDPVVVASAGPLPSATLHETAALFRHECLDTFTIGKGDGRCQEIIMRQHRKIGAWAVAGSHKRYGNLKS